VSTSNIELFEAAYQAYVERGDLEVFYWTLDPDVLWRARAVRAPSHKVITGSPGPRWMGTVGPAPTEPDKERCSAESSERSSLATTPEPRRDRLGSLPTPRPRFPPPSITTVDTSLPQVKSLGESATLFDRWPRDQSGSRRLAMPRTTSPSFGRDPVRLLDLENWPSCANRTAEWCSCARKVGDRPFSGHLPRMKGDDLLTGDVRDFFQRLR
jgi:hypothetical protein